MTSQNLVIIVPAYNEERSIVAVIEGLQALGPVFSKQGLKSSIVVINDGSTDTTPELARLAMAEAVISHPVNRGLGAAVRSGLIEARSLRADIVVKFDADLQHSPEDIPKLVNPILEKRADLVYGERFSKIDYKMPLIRRIGNTIFTRLMASLTRWPIQDSQPGIFAMNREYLEHYDIPGDYNYTQQLLMDAYLKGMRFEQVPVSFRQRKTGKSFVSLIYPLKVIPQIVLVLVVSRPLSFFFPVGMASFVIGASVFFYQLGQWLLGDAPKPVSNVNFVLGTLLFGLQTVFFGLLAQLIVVTRKR